MKLLNSAKFETIKFHMNSIQTSITSNKTPLLHYTYLTQFSQHAPSHSKANTTQLQFPQHQHLQNGRSSLTISTVLPRRICVRYCAIIRTWAVCHPLYLRPDILVLAPRTELTFAGDGSPPQHARDATVGFIACGFPPLRGGTCSAFGYINRRRWVEKRWIRSGGSSWGFSGR